MRLQGYWRKFTNKHLLPDKVQHEKHEAALLL